MTFNLSLCYSSATTATTKRGGVCKALSIILISRNIRSRGCISGGCSGIRFSSISLSYRDWIGPALSALLHLAAIYVVACAFLEKSFWFSRACYQRMLFEIYYSQLSLPRTLPDGRGYYFARTTRIWEKAWLLGGNLNFFELLFFRDLRVCTAACLQCRSGCYLVYFCTQ